MIVIANKTVDIYTTEPKRIRSNKKGTLNEGFEIEVEEVESIDENEIWYTDKNGDFYWSGDFDLYNVTEGNNPDSPNEKIEGQSSNISYRKIFGSNAPEEIKLGQGIKLAMLDSGIFRGHKNFIGSDIQLSPFYSSFIDVTDVFGHGTHLTGLICGIPTPESRIEGVSPNVSIEHFKVIDDNGYTNFNNLKKTLEHIYNNHEVYDIINMSFDITYTEYQQIETLLTKIYQNGIVLIGTAGDNDYLIDNINFPGYSEAVIAIGAIENESLGEIKNRLHDRVNYLFLDEKLYSTYCQPNLFKRMNGCSVYAAIISGMVANLLSNQELYKSERNSFVKEYLNHNALSFMNLESLTKNIVYKTI